MFGFHSDRWTEQQLLLGPADAVFGISVAVYNNTIVIGAYLDNSGNTTAAGL